jgi:hypothetical protein
MRKMIYFCFPGLNFGKVAAFVAFEALTSLGLILGSALLNILRPLLFPW